MKYILLLSSIIFVSCKQTGAPHKLYSADSVLVQFFTEDGIIYNAATSTEKSDIRKLTSFLNNRSSPPTNCGSRGKIQFFARDSLILDATYSSFVKGCRYFTYEWDGKLYHIAMSNEAADFLISLQPSR